MDLPIQHDSLLPAFFLIEIQVFKWTFYWEKKGEDTQHPTKLCESNNKEKFQINTAAWETLLSSLKLGNTCLHVNKTVTG